MAKTKDVIKILKKRFKTDPELQKYYEEEKIGLQVAQVIRRLKPVERGFFISLPDFQPTLQPKAKNQLKHG